MKAIFVGFIDREIKLCSQNNIDQEINFFIEMFVEKSHNRKLLMNLHEQYIAKQRRQQITNEDNETNKIVTLPWTPILDPIF